MFAEMFAENVAATFAVAVAVDSSCHHNKFTGRRIIKIFKNNNIKIEENHKNTKSQHGKFRKN